jgi:hypothetical protein
MPLLAVRPQWWQSTGSGTFSRFLSVAVVSVAVVSVAVLAGGCVTGGVGSSSPILIGNFVYEGLHDGA